MLPSCSIGPWVPSSQMDTDSPLPQRRTAKMLRKAAWNQVRLKHLTRAPISSPSFILSCLFAGVLEDRKTSQTPFTWCLHSCLFCFGLVWARTGSHDWPELKFPDMGSPTFYDCKAWALVHSTGHQYVDCDGTPCTVSRELSIFLWFDWSTKIFSWAELIPLA